MGVWVAAWGAIESITERIKRRGQVRKAMARASLQRDVTDEEALKGVEGVISAAVNFTGEEVLVRYDREVISGTSLMKAVADASAQTALTNTSVKEAPRDKI